MNANAHVTSITLTDAGTPLALSVQQALSDTKALGEIGGSYSVAITDSAANVASNFNALNSDGHVSSISFTDAGTPTLTLSIHQVLADTTALGDLSGTYTLLVKDTAANIQNLSVGAISALATAGVASVTATDASIVLSIATAIACQQSGLAIYAPAGKTVTVADTAANIASIDQSGADALKAAGYTSIASTTGAVTLSLAEAAILSGDGLTVTGGVVTVAATLTSLLALSPAQAAALVASGDVLSALDTAANIETLTATQIASLGTLHVTKIAASDTSVSLTTAQVPALESAHIAVSAPSGASVQLSGTAAQLQVLTATQIQGLSAIGVASLVSSNASIKFTVAQTDALETAGVVTHVAVAGGTVTVSDTGTNIATLSASQIGVLAGAGFSGITSTSGGVTLSVAQAVALEGVAKITVPSGSKVTISDTTANILGLTAAQISLLPGTGVSAIQASNAANVAFSVSQVLALESAKIGVTAQTGYAVSVSDTATNIQALTATAIAGLAGAGVSALTATDANVSLTVAKAQALETAKITLSVPTGDHALITDTAANIALLTATQIAGLGALHVTQIAASDASVSLTTAQAAALETAHIAVSAPSGASVELSGTAAQLQALTATQLQGLSAIGVASLVSTNASVKFTVAQTLALETVGLVTHVAVAGGTVTVSDTGTNIATLSASQIGALAGAGFSGIASTSGGVTLSVAQAVALEGVAKITVPSGSKVTISDTTANILGLTAAQISLLPGTGVSAIQASNAANVAFSVSQVLALESAKIGVTAQTGYAVSVSDTAPNIQALTATAIAGLAGAGVSALTATDANVSLTVAKAQALETAKITLSVPTGDHALITDTAANIALLTATQIAGLGALHVTQIAASDASVSLTTAQAAALETAHIAVSAPSGAHVTLSDTAANLQTLTTGATGQIQGLSGIGVASLYSNNANVTFSATQTSDIVATHLSVSASGTHSVTETFTNGSSVAVASNGSGGGTLNLGGNSVTVTSGPSQLSVMAGTQTLPLTDYSTESFVATGKTNETFVFAPNFGQDTITGFAASGTGHDTLQFTAASFGMSSGSTQASDLAAMLAHTTQNAAGNAVITDVYGDSVTLNGVTKATLSLPANAVDFKFT